MKSIFTAEPFNRVIRKFLGDGQSGLGKRSLGGGIWGFAIPAAIFVVEDMSRSDGIIIPLCKWVLNRTARVRVVEVSARPFRKSSRASSG